MYINKSDSHRKLQYKNQSLLSHMMTWELRITGKMKYSYERQRSTLSNPTNLGPWLIPDIITN